MMIDIRRNTKETQIELALGHPSSGDIDISMPCGFLTHMLTLLAHRARLALRIKASGDVEVDAHHLTEDVGIAMGCAMLEMLRANSSPRRRYGWCLLPMDGSLARVALDISGRGGLFWRGEFPTDRCGDFDMELVPEFFTAFCRESRTTMHVDILAADNSHHASEAVFKGVGLALDMALAPADAAPSTKGAWL